MLRMKSRKRTKKMRGGGIFGPVFSSHIDTAGNQASQGWNKFLSGVEVGRRESRIASENASRGYRENIKRTDALGGNPPLSTLPLPTTPPPSFTTSYKPPRPVLYSPTQDPLTLVKKYNKPTETIIGRGGKRKTKKRRRKRKKKKTKRKKRRRKRKTKKRRRKKYN